MNIRVLNRTDDRSSFIQLLYKWMNQTLGGTLIFISFALINLITLNGVLRTVNLMLL